MQNYKNLRIWKSSHHLVLAIYKVTMTLPKDEKHHLVNQVRRSATSVVSNIVEGCSRQTQKDKAHFIQISYGSANELEYQLLLLKDLGYLPVDIYDQLIEDVISVKRMVYSFLKKIRDSI